MPRPAKEWFAILDDKLNVIGPRSYPSATAAILAANDQVPWPDVRRLVVRSNYNESGIKVGDGAGRIAAIRKGARWSGPDVAAGNGYLVEESLEEAHERQYNLPKTGVDARAEMRVQIARETGKSPFDPSVVREARRRVARQLDTDIERVLQDPLPVVIAALPTIHENGRFGSRKVFIAALWERVGKKIPMSLVEFKRWLIDQHRQGRLELARADLIAAMPYDMVMRSEAKTEGVYSGATFHFVVDPSV